MRIVRRAYEKMFVSIELLPDCRQRSKGERGFPLLLTNGAGGKGRRRPRFESVLVDGYVCTGKVREGVRYSSEIHLLRSSVYCYEYREQGASLL